MAVTDSFVAFVVEQLDPLGPIASKGMFGGVGLYAGDLFLALIAGDVLYLKADESATPASASFTRLVTRRSTCRCSSATVREAPNRGSSSPGIH
jgi:TfoX/Sxy family transcriptional regulator of competence genes